MKLNSHFNLEPSDDNAEQLELPVSRQQGVSLVEIVLFMAVAVILLLAAFGLFGSSSTSAKTRTEAANVQGVLAGVQNVFGTRREYTAGTGMTGQLISANAVPAQMVITGNTTALRNQFGGEVWVQGVGTGFQIADNGLPKQACVELAQLPIQPVSVNVNGTLYNGLPTVTQAVQSCNAATNSVSWNF